MQLEENAVSIERIRETEKYAPRERDWRNPDEDPKGKEIPFMGFTQPLDINKLYRELRLQ